MPVQECQGDGGKPGYRWGSSGACYVYSPGDEAGRKKAKQKAYIQGSAISHSTGEPMKASQALTLEKALLAEPLKPLTPEEALPIINRLAAEPVEADQVYLRRFRLANDQIDRSFERFPVGYLERFAATLPGRPLLLSHDKNKVGVGRWFHASVARDPDGTHHLVADAYLPADSEAARLLKLGIANDVSIGFRAAGRTCDLCGERYDGVRGCEHHAGHEYDGRRCTVTYSGDIERVEALEGSLVGVGCQYNAQAMHAKGLMAGSGALVAIEEDEDMNLAEAEAKIKVLEDEIDAQKAKAALIADGELYHKDLKAEIARKLGVLQRPEAIELTLLDNAPLATLKAFDEKLASEINAKFPNSPQSKMLGGGAAPLPELGGPQPDGSPPPAARRDDPFFMLRS